MPFAPFQLPYYQAKERSRPDRRFFRTIFPHLNSPELREREYFSTATERIGYIMFE